MIPSGQTSPIIEKQKVEGQISSAKNGARGSIASFRSKALIIRVTIFLAHLGLNELSQVINRKLE